MHIHYLGEGALVTDNNKKIYVGKSELSDIKKTIIKDNSIFNTGYIVESGEQGHFYPELVNLFVTNKCPQRCIHCFNESDINSYEMDFKDIKKIITIINRKVPNINLSGGEPLIHRDFLNIVELIRDFN